MRVRWRRVGVLCCLLPLSLGAGDAGAAPSAASSTLIRDDGAHMDVNDLDMFMTNYGSFCYDVNGGNAGLIFPRGMVKTVMFAAGLWIGAEVEGNLRVSAAEYSMTYGPGKILPSGLPADPAQPEYRLYRIEAWDTSSDDYRSWPCGDGAPCLPDGKPRPIGDQTIWSIFNDISPYRENNNAATLEGLGVEIQQTTFGFGRSELGRAVFMSFRIINPPTGDYLRDAYVSVWSDPDLGGASDDLVGCDTTLSLGYCYNATNSDIQYGSSPPCRGLRFPPGAGGALAG